MEKIKAVAWQPLKCIGKSDHTLITHAWGYKIRLFKSAIQIIDKLIIQPGGYCSVHRHLFVTNQFHVLSGQLNIKWCSNDSLHVPDSCTILKKGDTFIVPSENVHQFTSRGGATVLEFVRIDPNADITSDIIRYRDGGIQI